MDEQGHTYDMIYFGDMDNWHDFLSSSFGKTEQERLYHEGSRKIVIQMIYYPDINVYQGRENLQIVMQDYAK